MSHSFEVEWRSLLSDMTQHTDIFGNDLFPLSSVRHWLSYNEILKRIHVYENQTSDISNVGLDKTEVKELKNFWKFAQDKCKKEGTVLALWKEESDSTFQIRAFFKDKIKNIESVVKGDIQ